MSNLTDTRPQPSPTAMTSLLLGVASVALPVVAGLPAVFVGYRALYRINASEGQLTGRRFAIAGMILGGLTTLIGVAGFIVLIFINLGEKSRYVECKNNLGRMGMAINVYHDSSPGKTYPRAAIANADVPLADRLSWHTSILPDLDRKLTAAKKWQHVNELVDLKLGWNDPANAAAADTVVAPFLCPNNPTYNPPVVPAPTHYVGIAGLGSDAADLPKDDERAGFFGYERVITRTDLTAGTGHTLMVLETAADNGPWIAAGFSTVRGIPDVDRLIGVGAPFGGCHADGMNALFADGAVHFERDTIEPAILRSLARLNRK